MQSSNLSPGSARHIRTMHRRTLLTALLLCLLYALPTYGAPRDPLDREWAKIASPGPDLQSREIMRFVLEAAGGAESAARAPEIEQSLEDLERMQDKDPASKSYGNFCWYWHETKPGDRNAVEFITQAAALLRMRFEDRLSPKGRGDLDRLLALAIEGIHRQRVEVAYTNIYLMKCWNLLALGQALKRADLSTEGSAMLDDWIAFTARNGIHEYLSPTYYGVTLDSLGLMAGNIRDKDVHGKAIRCLNLVWDDIAANWFEPCGRLGGAHGRDYDYLTGHGDLDRHLADAGWIPPPAQPGAGHGVFNDAARWTPPDALRKEALSDIPRFVYQKWDAGDEAWAAQYVGHDFSIGVSGSCQGPEDKPFAINLAGPTGPKMVMVNFFMDGRGDAYGKIKTPTGSSGHPKAHHLTPYFHAVQRDAEVLFLASYPSGSVKDKPAPVCLYSHMDLPAEAEVWTKDGRTDPSQASQPLPEDVCFIRMGDVAVGIRFLMPQTPEAEVINDGAAYHARRLTIAHSTSPPSGKPVCVAVFARAAEGLDEAGFAEFRKAFLGAKTSGSIAGTIAQANAAGLKGELKLEADIVTGKLITKAGSDASREVPPMSVDGRDFSAVLSGTGVESGF